jgi:hypothetical protein
MIPRRSRARLYMSERYMYHCHSLEHKNHEMIRPYVVMSPNVACATESGNASTTP